MNTILKQGDLALAIFGSAALFAGPTLANSLHDEGDFGVGYEIIGPNGGPERHDYLRKHTFRPYSDGPAYYYGPSYSVGYGPEYYDAPNIEVWEPDVEVGY